MSEENPTPSPLDPRREPPRRSGTVLRYGLYLIVIVLLSAGVVWIVRARGAQNSRAGRSSANPAVPVVTAIAQTGDLPVALNALGTVTPLATVTVKTQVSGRLMAIGFKEGQMVRAGDFLGQIDPRPCQIALEQAEGQLLRDQALLVNAEVDLARRPTGTSSWPTRAERPSGSPTWRR